MLEVPDLRNPEQLRSHDAIAEQLVRAVPESDRAEARRLLAMQLLPNLIGDLAKPRVPPGSAYEQLASVLTETPAHDRLAALRSAAAHAEMREQVTSAVSLAIARYAQEHPDARDAAEEWPDPVISRYLAMPVDRISEEASRRLSALGEWERRVRERHPKVWESDRVAALQAELSLQSARTGHYGTAAGGLYDFLHSVGASVDELDEH